MHADLLGWRAGLAESEKPNELPVCGIIMPISGSDGCTESHWLDVRSILCAAANDAALSPGMVSEAKHAGIIQKRILKRIYDDPIVICDVSANNPNVMLELGVRLAFDKPVVVVKDDKTPFSFDTAPIEHIEYPRDLRFQDVVDFKEILSGKLKHTLDAYRTNPDSVSFLKAFGTFKVPKLDQEVVPKEDFILSELGRVSKALDKLSNRSELNLKSISNSLANAKRIPENHERVSYLDIFSSMSDEEIRRVLESISYIPGIKKVTFLPLLIGISSSVRFTIHFRSMSDIDAEKVKSFIGSELILKNGLFTDTPKFTWSDP